MTTKDRVAKALIDGSGVGQAAEQIGVHRNTVSYHKKSLGIVPDAVSEYRADVLLKLAEIESLVSDPALDKIDKAKVLLDVVKQLRAIYGTDSPTKSISATFSANPEHSREYMLFREATAGLDDDQLHEVYTFAKTLKRSWTPPPVDADFPKPEEKEAEDASE
jgi:hypothetical protein